MKYEWIIWLLVPGLVYVSGRYHTCNSGFAEAHYEELLKYGDIDIPLHFEDEEERNVTCGNIILSIEYIFIYKTWCSGGKEFFKKMLNLNYLALDHITDRLCSEYSSLFKANNWDTEAAESYLTQLEKYMYEDLPLYGKDWEELNDVCRNMSESIEYLQMYLDKYTKKKECESYQCQGLINSINILFIYFGIKDLAEELCNEHSLIRKTYLEIYPCLENNSHHFSVCNNKAEASLKYLNTIYFENIDPKHESCCVGALYHDCITSITEDHCDEKATLFVSFVLEKILGNDTDGLCLSSGILCSAPPLLPEDHTEKAQHKNEYGTFNPKVSETDEVDSLEKVNIDGQETISSSIILCPSAGTMIVSNFILFMHFLIF